MWEGYKTNGYGYFWCEGKEHRSHRVSFLLDRGEWPKEECCHKCDVKNCVNPKHLWDGSHQENMSHARSHGIEWTQKLSDQEVMEMRKRHESEDVSQRQLADDYGVSQKAVWRVVNQKPYTQLAHDAALRERVAELEDLVRNIGGHVDDGIAGRITADHAVGEVAAELDDFRARRALNKGGQGGG